MQSFIEIDPKLRP